MESSIMASDDDEEEKLINNGAKSWSRSRWNDEGIDDGTWSDIIARLGWWYWLQQINWKTWRFYQIFTDWKSCGWWYWFNHSKLIERLEDSCKLWLNQWYMFRNFQYRIPCNLYKFALQQMLVSIRWHRSVFYTTYILQYCCINITIIYQYCVMNYSINSFTGASEAPVNVVVVY